MPQPKPLILVTGSQGQLGFELQRLAPAFAGFSFLFTDRQALDLGSDQAIWQLVRAKRPAYVINAAAYTAVDKAESDRDTALRINAGAVGTLAEACAETGGTLLQLSTDYVFNGQGNRPYREDDPTDPVNYYGDTKMQGEALALSALERTVVVRTSWVYSTHGHNFVKTMLRLMREKTSVSVVNDQLGSPTYAADLAAALLQIIARLAGGQQSYGIYHFSNEGVTSWYAFATAIRDLKNLPCDVQPVPTSAYPTAARRPAYSVMDKEKICHTFGIKLVDWQASLRQCLELL